MQTQTDRKIAEEQKKTYEMQEAAKVLASGEAEAVKLRAEGDGQAQRLRGLGEAEAIRAVGSAKAEAYLQGTQSLGAGPYTLIQLMQAIAEGKVKVTPDMLVQGGEGHGTLMDTLLGLLSQSRP